MILADRASVHSKLDHIADLYRRSGMPQAAHLDVTYRCDLDCVHCYLDEKDRWPEMKREEWLDAITQVAGLGAWELAFSGGEIFARPDMLDMLAHSAQLGFRSRIKTHAGNIDDALAREVAKLRVWRADVSIYSLDPDVHDAITAVPGSLERSMRGIEALLRTDMRVRVNVSVFRSNLDELEDINAVIRKMGANPAFSTQMYPDQSGSAMLDALQLTGEELWEADRRIIQMRADAEIREEILPRRFNLQEEICGAGRTLIYIAPDGAVWPCVQFPMALGNLRDKPLAEIWNNNPLRQQIVDFTNDDRTECKSCGGASMCFYCPGEAYKRTGDFRKAPDVFHMRTLSQMHAHKHALGLDLDEDDFASVPAHDPDELTPRKRNFVFPIYRPDRLKTQRAAVAAATKSAG